VHVSPAFIETPWAEKHEFGCGFNSLPPSGGGTLRFIVVATARLTKLGPPPFFSTLFLKLLSRA
jgi:hypothetical protein